MYEKKNYLIIGILVFLLVLPTATAFTFVDVMNMLNPFNVIYEEIQPPVFIVRNIDSNIISYDSILTVNLSVFVDEKTVRFYILEEDILEGWEVVDPGELVIDNVDKKLKIVVLSGASDKTYTYKIRPSPNSNEGKYYFYGTYQGETMEDMNEIEGSEFVDLQKGVKINPYMSFYSGTYKVLSQSGNESLYNVTFKTIPIIIDKINIRNDTLICLEANFSNKETETRDIYEVPTEFTFYKSKELVRQTNIDRVLVKADPLSITPDTFEEGDRYRFCYQANPKEDFYLKFGDHSVIVIQDEDIVTTSYLNNATVGTELTNFTHLSIDYTSSPFNKLVAYYPFDGEAENYKFSDPASNMKLINDWGNYSIDGYVYHQTSEDNNVTINSTDCLYGQCAHFDSDGDHITAGYPLIEQLPFSGNMPMTLSAWIRTDSAVVDADSILWRTDECVVRMQGTTNIEVILNSLSTDDRTDSTSGTISAGTWNHVGLWYNGTTQLCAVLNGVMEGCTVVSGSYGTCEYFVIGGRASGPATTNEFSGEIDEVMFFNYSLTDQELLDLYNNQSSRFYSSGEEKVKAVNKSNESVWWTDGDNRVNLSVNYQNLFDSNISARVGEINISVNNSDLLGFYPMEWGTGADISGNDNDCVKTGTVFNITGGLNGTGGIEFNGDDYLNCGDYDANETLTISAWAKPLSSTETMYIVAKSDLGGGTYSHGLYYGDNNKFGFFVSDDGTAGSLEYVETANTYSTLNTWYHVVAGFNGSVYIYVDGVYDTDTITGDVDYIYDSSIDVTIGSGINGGSGTAFWNGSLDNVMVFNRTLSEQEIANIYNNQTSASLTPYYTDYQNITASDTEHQFNIDSGSDYIFPDFILYSGNSSTNWYSPIINDSITLETWWEEEIPAEISINLSNINTSNEINVTYHEFFNITLNVTCVTGSCGTVNVSLDPYGWDITSTTLFQNQDVLSNETNPRGLFFKEDGTKMYLIGTNSDKVHEYNVTDLWNITSLLYIQSYSVASQDGAPNDVFLKPDGTRMYVLGDDNDNVYEYSLSTPWNITTSTFLYNYSVTAKETAPKGMFFSSDGTKMYVTGDASDDVNEYSLSTVWNVSTASFSQAVSISGQELFATDVCFSPDGLYMFISGNEGDEVHSYNLSTAWDVSTITYINLYDATAEEINPNGIFFKPDGTKMYMAGGSGQDINEYNLNQLIDKGGLISTTPGDTPFYTNASTNPQTTSSLSAGQSELVVFYVNATGQINGTYNFFAYANVTSDMTIYNETASWNVTIIESEAIPTDTCTYTSGNWAIDCSDNCNITSAVDMGGNNITMLGAGNVWVNALIHNYTFGLIGDSCKVWWNV